MQTTHIDNPCRLASAKLCVHWRPRPPYSIDVTQGFWRCVAIVIVLLAARPAVAEDPPTDAISREVGVFNDLTSSNPASDAISREVSVLKEAAAEPPPSDAISREVGVFNEDSLAFLSTDAISREVSVDDKIHCTGDFNGDFVMTVSDIGAFTDVLIGIDTHPARRDAADVNCDGAADGMDIQPFVACLLSGACP